MRDWCAVVVPKPGRRWTVTEFGVHVTKVKPQALEQEHAVRRRTRRGGAGDGPEHGVRGLSCLTGCAEIGRIMKYIRDVKDFRASL